MILNMRIYVSGPLHGGDREANVRRAIDAADQLLRARHAPFVPHLFQTWHEIHPHDEETWLRLDLEYLASCDAMVRLPGPSPGAEVEEEYAAALGIPVFRSVADILSWDREREPVAVG